MALPRGYVSLKDSAHPHPKGHKRLKPTHGEEQVTVTLLLRRRPGGPNAKGTADFIAARGESPKPLSRSQFANTHGADQKELKLVQAFAREHGLTALESSRARRSVVLRGPAAAINKAFAVQLRDYQYSGGTYRSHDGPASLPSALAEIVEAVVGLTNRKVPAKHFAARRVRRSADPPDTQPLNPQEVAALYEFPAGDGSGQTIGLYEMETEGPAGYSIDDIRDSLHAFGGGLKVPTLIDVSIDGVRNSGRSDGETGLDITVASAIAPGAKIAVYFTGSTVQAIIHALQRMIHPGRGDPEPTIMSISYGWGPDDGSTAGFSEAEYAAIGRLFQDAAHLGITVLVSSGDSGAMIADKTRAQTSYPATDPWVIACGGTTIGNVRGASFDEYAWNDRSASGNHSPGAGGGGISARFPVPSYQKAVALPKNRVTGKAGRGIPDVAGNASENSGYIQYINGVRQPVGGTSAVAPLYAGLIARINGNLGRPAGFINPLLYRLAGSAFRDIAGPAGPANNSFGRVAGYPVGIGWDACTGLGSVKGMALQNGLASARAGRLPPPGAARAEPGGKGWPRKVFETGTFRGVDVRDAFARAALRETPVVTDIGDVPWPSGLAPKPVALGNHRRGEKITGPLDAKADVLIVLYTELETQALLEVFTGDKAWTDARRKQWCGYGHNFAKYRPMIGGIGGDKALKQGLFGYLSAVKIGSKTVALFKSELHPKQNGDQLPFVPVMQQLINELEPSCVISTGTAGAIGNRLNCGDVAITSAARFHVEHHYPNDPGINVMSADNSELSSAELANTRYIDYAAKNFTKLSLAGLAQCYAKLQQESGYGFVKKNERAPAIYVAGKTPVPGPQPMAIVSADYLTVDDSHDVEGLQALGIMNDTDDAFLFYAISRLSGPKPQWVSVRNASEPQIASSRTATPKELASIAGRIYGIYQYCTTLNSAFACWGVVASL